MSEEALEEALESFLSGAAMGWIGNISQLFVDEAKNSDYNDLTNQSDAQTPEIPDNLDPKAQRALQDYQRHQQQRDTIRELLHQEQSYESRSELQKRLTREESTLQALEKDPVLQQALQKGEGEQSDKTDPINEKRHKVSTEAPVTHTEIITDGSHVDNGKLKPNVTYQTGEFAYIYTTNSEGLISEVYVEELNVKKHEKRLTHKKNTLGKRPGDHAGHLIADRFGGSPELDNLVTQAAKVNLKHYKKIENMWAKALKQGLKVTVNITVNYDSGTRPASFDVIFKIDGKQYTKNVKNE